MERVRLFSAVPTKRYKLFSKESESEEKVVEFVPDSLKKVVCKDCGYEMETGENNNKVFCPNCGGTRFNLYADEVKSERVSLFSNAEDEFQKEFSKGADEFELKLKDFSGKTLTEDEYQKEFSSYLSESELVERGFGEVEGGNVLISSDAYLMSRLFSSIKVSITKSLEFDPAIMNCENKGEVIDRVAENNDMPMKIVALLKKAHGLSMRDAEDAWIEDSGIIRDLKLEYGDRIPKLEFEKVLVERYPDAPENIIEILKERGDIEESHDEALNEDVINFK